MSGASLFDIAIVGAGMAGASLAAMLPAAARVVLIEAEARPGYHATGRSAAFWSETYGGPAVQPLTSASFACLARPPAAVSEAGFLTPRGCLHIADEAGLPVLDALAAEFAGTAVRLDRLDRADLDARVPGLAPGWRGGLAEPSCQDIDVAGLHAAFLRAASRRGVVLLCDARVEALSRGRGRWRIETRAGTVEAATLVNAAGAWASPLAAMAGASPIAIAPYRRTMVQLRVDPPVPPALPLLIDARGRFYLKPEAGGRLWLSPHDETPALAGDVAADELDVAIAIDRLERAVDWRVRAREHAWAGLRSFAPDRAPVYGHDARAPGFFWCAGQGGFGIQTAPAAAMLAAALLTGGTPPEPVARIDAARYAPGRFG